MSSPHMAGFGALMKQSHPDWSPMAIKSAFMTTATRLTNKGNPIAGDAFAYGAGFVRPNSANDPGLVYDSGFSDWMGFLCGSGELQAPYCAVLGFDPSDLNYPSIAIGTLLFSQTIVRTVTNVGNTATYTFAVDGLAGIGVVVEPEELTLTPGESVSYTVEFTNIGAQMGDYVTGGITWSDGIHEVRSPIVLRPDLLDYPQEVAGSGISGSAAFDISFGYTDSYSAVKNGLVAATKQEDTVLDDPANDINVAFATFAYTVHVVETTPGAVLQRIALFDDYTDGDDDLDFYVFNQNFVFVGSSASPFTSTEQVDIINPSSPYYFVLVHGKETDGPEASYTLFNWSPSAVDVNNKGDLTDAPTTAILGATDTINVSWTGLLDDEKYLGVISHQKDGSEIGQTVINVQND
jgi:hypothetical protein